MIILLIVLTIIITTLITIYVVDDYDVEMPISVGGVLLIVEIIALLIFTHKLISFRVIDDKIELYKKQNKNIEEKIELVVKEYKDFEKDTFINLKADSYITLVNLYPELKSDEMVKRQIDLYEKNNKKITSLKEEKINKTIYRWWVYFGK